MDLVTVIIPYFKKKKFIKETLKSVLTQTYKKLEIIIIYDDEDQSDLKYIKKLKNLDKRIKIIINKNSLGAGKSRNIGIKKSQGKYISFIDADDIWKRRKIECQIDFMKKQNYSISHTDYTIVNKKKLKIGFRKARTFENIHQLLKSCDIGLSTVIVNKKIFKNDCFFPNLKTKEDFVLWLKILKKKEKIGALNINLMFWRKLKNSLSASVIQKLLDGFRVYNVYMNFNWIKSLYFLICLSLNFLKK